MAAEALNNTFTAFGPKPETQRRAQETQETVQVDYSQVEDLCAEKLTLEESLKGKTRTDSKPFSWRQHPLLKPFIHFIAIEFPANQKSKNAKLKSF